MNPKPISFKSKLPQGAIPISCHLHIVKDYKVQVLSYPIDDDRLIVEIENDECTISMSSDELKDSIIHASIHVELPAYKFSNSNGDDIIIKRRTIIN